MTQYLSDKLRVMSLLAILFVLYIHSGFHADEIQGMVVNGRVQEFVSGMMGRCAVPLFYVISGYLFFLKVPDGMKSIYGKMKKRVRTLLVPYLIGCLFFVGFLALVECMPFTSRFMNTGIMPLFQKSIGNVLCSIFFDAGNGSPCAFQLWFLRNLILIVATSPVWYVCLKRLGWTFVAVVFVLNFVDMSYNPFYSLFWFVLGGQLVKYGRVFGGGNSEKSLAKRIGALCLIVFICLSFCQLFLPTIAKWEMLRIPIIMIGIIGVWWLYDAVAGGDFSLTNHRWVGTACRFTFFIYLFHEPTLNIVRKLIVVVLGKNEVGYMVSYLLSPWIFAVCAVLIGMVLRRYCGRVYEVCVGGR